MFSITVSNELETQQLTHNRGPLELGRGPAREGTVRVVIRDGFVSRDHVRLEEMPGGRVRIVNLSTKAPVTIDNHSTLNPGTDCEYPLPVRLEVGKTVIDLESAEPESLEMSALRTCRAPVRGDTASHPNLLALTEGTAAEEVVGWLETVVDVQKASGQQEFFQQTANALVERIGLDTGLVILHEAANWRGVGGQTTG